MPRHMHSHAYVTVVLRGRYRQLGFAGRLECQEGDILLQPALDCHRDEMLSRGLELPRLPWRWEASFGGIYRNLDVETIRRAAESDLHEAVYITTRELAGVTPVTMVDSWQDVLCARLRNERTKIGEFADELGLPREVVTRGFSTIYGTPPSRYRRELRAQRAILEVLSTQHRLCDVAADAGFADQAHMTRENQGPDRNPASETPQVRWEDSASIDSAIVARAGLSRQWKLR